MDEPSNLADHILDQVADAVIFADRSGTIAVESRLGGAVRIQRRGGAGSKS